MDGRFSDSASIALRIAVAGAMMAAAVLTRAATTPGPVPRAEVQPAEPALSAMCSAASPTGVGLHAEYFVQSDLKGTPAAFKIHPTVEFGSAAELPAAAGIARVGSARWAGWVKAVVSGTYRFDGGSNEVEVVVANSVLSGAKAAPGASISLEAGRFYPIRIELARVTNQAPIHLKWTVPYGAHYVIPRQLLFMPTETVKPAS